MGILKTQRSRGGGRRIKKFGSRKTNVSSRSKILRNCSEIGGEKLSEKLQALKNLLPPTEQSRRDADVKEDSGGGETEQLFQETADYIVQLRNQVVVLQKLIEIYGSSSDQTKDFVL